MDVILIRHGESTYNAEARWQGQTDVPLSKKGEEEARALARRLERHSFDRVVSSDLVRAHHTARIAIDGRSAVEVDPAFREIDVGAWSGLDHGEVRTRYPHEVDAMREGADIALGGGESIPQFDRRIREALGRIFSEGRERVVIFTHGGVIRSILMGLLELERGRPLIGARNSAITHLRGTKLEDVLIVSYNCSAHLGGIAQRDEAVRGEQGRARTAAHLGLSERATLRLVTPKENELTYLARQEGIPMLRAYAVPSSI